MSEAPFLGPVPTEDWLRLRARVTPRAPAVVMATETWTFARWDEQVERAAWGLWAWGVRPGTRVAFWRLSRPQALVLVWAVARVGAVLVPLHDRWTARELESGLRLTGPRLVVIPEDASWPGAGKTQVLPWSALLDRGQRSGESFPPQPPRGLQGVVFTSGSTGEPKAVALTWTNHFWSAWASAARLGLYPRDAWWLSLPLYHVGGLAVLWRAVLYGIAVVLPPHEGSGFDPETLRFPPGNRRPTLLSLVPTMLYRMLEAGVEPWPELRVVLLGGAGAPEALVREALDRGWPLALTYGMTEAASQIATAPPALVRRKPGTVGPPLMFTQVRVTAATGAPAPVGQPGALWVRGPTVSPGYWGNDQATRRAFHQGWLATGDEGWMDEEGHLWVLGRSAWVINTGGEKVYPQEVEAVLLQHPAVRQACVVGVPHPEWGQQVAAAVVLRPGREVTLQELERHCRRALAGYKIPRRWKRVAHLPLTASGKVDRRQVQAWLEAD